MRIFFAIELTPDISELIKRTVTELKRLNPKVDLRWTKIENLHITLQFLAHVEPLELDTLIREVKKQLVSTSSFVVALEQINFFPSIKRPAVLALNVRASDELMYLAHQLMLTLDACSQQVDTRHFKPHMTLARIHNHYPVRRYKLLQIPATTFAVDHINLYQSELTEAGRRYQVLERFDLMPGPITNTHIDQTNL
jgi:2'-5' RNA ligase